MHLLVHNMGEARRNTWLVSVDKYDRALDRSIATVSRTVKSIFKALTALS